MSLECTTELIHLSVTTIQAYAFNGCDSLERVTMPDTVTEIEDYAFCGCVSLRFIRLSTNLEFIGYGAFHRYYSKVGVFLPPTVTRIDDPAFNRCTSLRFCILSEAIEYLGDWIFFGCDRLLTTIKYNEEDEHATINNDEVNEWMMQRHANLPFLKLATAFSLILK